MATSTGIPAQSDRSAWESDTYPEKHAIDLYNSVPKHHLPLGNAVGNYPRWDGSKWVAQAFTVSDLALTDAHIFVGNSSNQAADVALSGDAAIDDTGALTVNQGSSAFALTNSITPASLGGDQNDYNPTGLSTASAILQASSVDVNITGLQGGSAGRLMFLLNINTAGGKKITLKAESGLSSAGNRFAGTADVDLNPQTAILLRYSISQTRWFIVGGSGGGATGGHTIQDEGTPLTARTNLNFVGAGVAATDDAGNNASKVTIPGMAGDPLWDAKGDLAVASGADAAAKLTVGTNGEVLAADSSQTLGVKWQNIAAGLAYETNVGDTSNTSYTVTHNLHTRDVTVHIYDNSTYAEFSPSSITHTTVDTVTVVFAAPPSTNQYRVVVVLAATNVQGPGAIEMGVDGGAGVPSTGVVYNATLRVPCNLQITSWTLLADISGSVVLNLWKTDYAGYPPNSGQDVTGSDKPTLASQQKNTSSGLSGWTTGWSVGDIIWLNISSVSVLHSFVLVLNYNRT